MEIIHLDSLTRRDKRLASRVRATWHVLNLSLAGVVAGLAAHQFWLLELSAVAFLVGTFCYFWLLRAQKLHAKKLQGILVLGTVWTHGITFGVCTVAIFRSGSYFWFPLGIAIVWLVLWVWSLWAHRQWDPLSDQ